MTMTAGRLDLKPIKALSFDCYGTLIDWETGLATVLNAWAGAHGIAQRDDALLEAFGRHESAVEAERPTLLYPAVLRAVLDRLAAEHGIAPSEPWAERLAQSVGDWPAFPDSPEALQALGRRFDLCILSNVDRQSFRRSETRLMVSFDLVLTAEEIGSYKPDRRNFEALLGRLAERGIARHEVLHVAQSLFHDHAPASELGFQSIWIDRRHGRPGGGATVTPAGEPRYDGTFPSMRAFAAWALEV